MIKKPLNPHRVRKITSSFAFIEHRFLRDGFWSTLDQHQLLLYMFLIIVGDRNGLSYYSYDKIWILLKIAVDDYIVARDALIEKDLIGFDGHLFQVLSLPDQPIDPGCTALKSKKDMQKHDPATIHQPIGHSFWRKPWRSPQTQSPSNGLVIANGQNKTNRCSSYQWLSMIICNG